MKYTLIILLAGLVIACGPAPEHNNASEPVAEIAGQIQIIQNVAAGQFKEKLQLPNAQLVDVRSPQEWAQGVISEPIKANYQATDFEDKLAELDKTKPVLVYCASGGRSGRAMKIMKEKGFTEVYNLDGGIGAWQDAGFDVSPQK